MPLSDSQILEVERHFDRGLSSKKSAELLSTEDFKVTRSQISGYRKRLGLRHDTKGRVLATANGDRPAYRQKIEAVKLRVKMAEKKATEERATTQIHAGHKPLISREFGECAWPVSRMEGETYYCCDRVMPGKPYCPVHAKIAYTKDERTKKGNFRLPR